MIDAKSNEVLWVEKYRPQIVDDTILPNKTKETFRKFVSDGSVPNLLLTGGPGVGKTTIAKAMLEELGWETLQARRAKIRTWLRLYRKERFS